MDHLSVWSARGGGYRDLVCNFWTSASLAHPTGASFEGRYSSDVLAQALLAFVMEHQSQFTRPADAGPNGLVLIHPPDADERREAASWMKSVQAPGIEATWKDRTNKPGPKPSTKSVKLGRPQKRNQVFTSATRSYPNESVVDVPARTQASNHFESRYAWPE